MSARGLGCSTRAHGPPAVMLRAIGRAAVVMTLALLVTPLPAAAQASSYVPLDDPAYRDLDLLRATGLLSREPVGQRPYSRLAVSTMVREALAALEEAERGFAETGGRTATAARTPTLAAREALQRLRDRFGTETEPGWGVAVRRASLRGTWADSPPRAIPTSYTDSTRIVGQVNPLLDGDLGRVRADGWTGAAEVALEARLGGRLVVYVHPRGWAERPRVSDGTPDVSLDGTLHEAYVRAVAGNLAVEVGRNHGLMGQGSAAGAMLSANARGLDMVRVGNDALVRLPWILDGLGPTRVTFLFADLGADRVIPHSKVLMGKVSVRPTVNLELGVSYLNQQWGEGAPEAELGERLLDLFLPFPFIDFEEISERMYGVDVRYRRPERGLELYLDGMATDFNGGRLHEVLWEEAAWLGGLRLEGLGAEGRFGLGVEFQRNGIRPYTHHHFYSGMTLDGLVLGNPLGPHATGWTLRGSWLGTAHTVDLALSAVWFSGDRYRGNDRQSTRFRWNKVAERPDEVRLGAVATWRMHASRWLRPSLRAGVERVRNAGFAGSDRISGVAEIVVEVGR